MSYNTVTVTDVATLIIQANTLRHSLVISNNGSQKIFLGEDNAVLDTTGTPLLPNEKMSEDSGGTKLYQGPVWGIASAGGSVNVRYWERTRK